MLQRRKCAAAAVGAIAQAAGQADPHLRSFQIQSIRVNDVGGMGQRASHRDHMHRLRLAPVPAGRVTARAKHRYAAPSGNSATCTSTDPGCANALCTIQRGHDPP